MKGPIIGGIIGAAATIIAAILMISSGLEQPIDGDDKVSIENSTVGNILIGGDGDDVQIGGLDSNIFEGGDGDDVQIGGNIGGNVFTGGKGADTFVIGPPSYDKIVELMNNNEIDTSNVIQLLINNGKYYNEKELYDEAEKNLDLALELNPTNVQVIHQKGITLVHKEQFTQALELLRYGLEQDPDNPEELLHVIGVALNRSGNPNDALQAYHQVLEINSNMPGTLFNIGYILQSHGNDRDAITYFNKSLELDPNNKAVWVHRGISLNNIGLYDNAIDSVKMGLEIDPNYDHANEILNKIQAIIDNQK